MHRSSSAWQRPSWKGGTHLTAAVGVPAAQRMSQRRHAVAAGWSALSGTRLLTIYVQAKQGLRAWFCFPCGACNPLR